MNRTNATAVTAAQAEALFGIPAERTYRWHKQSRIVVRARHGKHLLFSLADLRELNAQAERDPRNVYRTTENA